MDSKIIAKAFRIFADALDEGRCEITEEASEHIFRQMMESVNIPISKAEACAYLNMSRSTFDAKVAAGELPKGRRRRGFKELYWIKNELK